MESIDEQCEVIDF